MKRPLLMLVIIGATLSVAADNSFLEMKNLGKQSVILPAEIFQSKRVTFLGNEIEVFWTPDANVVKKAEEELLGYLKERKSEALRKKDSIVVFDLLIANIHHQRRQYVGVIVEGKQLLHINFFPPVSQNGSDIYANWRKQYIVVDDGGSNFWRIDFNPSTRVFSRLIVNGES
jgi:hypothetical protein